MDYIDLSNLPKCDVDWNSLEPITGGRLCTKCNKCIVDFTRMPDSAVAKAHLESNEPVCGFYRPDQYRILHKKPQSKTWKWPISLLTSILIGTISNAQHTPQETHQEQRDNSSESKLEKTKTPKGISLRLIDSVHSEPIPYANVVVYNKGTFLCGVSTNFDGEAFISFNSIPDSISVFEIRASMPGYAPYKVSGISKLPKSIEIAMKEDSAISYGVTVIKASFWQKIKWRWYALWHKKSLS